VVTYEDTLIERAACGDQEAFRHLWEAHHAAGLRHTFTSQRYAARGWGGAPSGSRCHWTRY